MTPGLSLFAAAALLAGGPRVAAGVPPEVRICSTFEDAAPPGTGAVLLVFFSIECPVCYEELFEARYLVDKGGWPITVIGVSIALREDLEAFLAKHSWTAPVILDRRRALFRKYDVDAVPFKILLRGTEEVYRDDPYLGPEARREELIRCLTRHFSR
jgi:hypothetical protein